MGEPTPDETGRVTVGTKVTPETRKRLRVIAARQDTTMSKLLREKIDEILAEADEEVVA